MIPALPRPTHADLEYAATHGHCLLLDLYLPQGRGGPWPVIVYIHGGAWRSGSKENPVGAFLVGLGFAVASINYRLTGVATFPAQIRDCKAAVRWLRAHAGDYGLDADRIGAFGISAGGHLAALLGTAGDVPEFDEAHGCREYSSHVQAVCDFFGPSDFLPMDDQAGARSRVHHDAADSPESLLIGGPVQENPEKARRASPITYITPQNPAAPTIPPFLIIHGDADPIVPVGQSELLHAALVRAGADSVLKIIPGGNHGFTPAQRMEVAPQVIAFFNRYLKGQ